MATNGYKSILSFDIKEVQMKPYASSLKGVSLVSLVLGLSLCFNIGLAFSQDRNPKGPPQPNIPSPQKDVDLNSVSTSSSTFASVPGTIVSVPFDDINRRCVVQFSTEVSATRGDRCDVALRLDGGACSTAFGPEFFATNSDADSTNAIDNTTFEAHQVQWVVLVGPGAHTFTPCFASRVVSADTLADSCTFFFRTTTVECYAN
jgi:hypothetical protein